MSDDFCEFVPEADECNVDPKPDNKGDGGHDGDHDGDHDKDHHMKEGNPMMGNLTYLHVALASTIHAGLELFVYHEDDEYSKGDVLGTNYYSMLGNLHHYSHFGIMSILTVTQILSMVGILGEINIMAWMYAEMIEQVLQLVLKLGYMYTYDAAYVIKNDSSKTSTE